MGCTIDDVNQFLYSTKELITNDKYTICQNRHRQDNYQLLVDFVIDEYMIKSILLSLTNTDFVKCEPNNKEKYRDEIVYVFGKNVDLLSTDTGEFEEIALYIKICIVNAFCTVISFHRAKYPLQYAFNSDN